MNHLRLVVCDGADVAEQTYSRFPVRIGRHPQNECQLRDFSVSRFHTQVDCGPRGIVLRDIGSRNGTVVLDGVTARRLRSSTEAFGDAVGFKVGNIRVLARLEDRVANALPNELVRVFRDASRDLSVACARRGVSREASDPEALRAIFDALYRNLFSVRSALQQSAAIEDWSGLEAPPPRSEPVAALLKWAQSTSVALRLLEHGLDGRSSGLSTGESLAQSLACKRDG